MVNPKKQWIREDNEEKLLFLLHEYKELPFRVLKEKLKVSEPTLTKYIKRFEMKKKIESFNKPEDRRYKWYRLRDETVKEVQKLRGKFNAIRFIEEIANPQYIDAKSNDGRVAVGVFTSLPDNVAGSPLEKVYEKLNEILAKKLCNESLNFLPRLLRVSPKNSPDKLAVVIMIRGVES
jgi:DNA-binding MarR family transcriptional regulator